MSKYQIRKTDISNGLMAIKLAILKEQTSLLTKLVLNSRPFGRNKTIQKLSIVQHYEGRQLQVAAGEMF